MNNHTGHVQNIKITPGTLRMYSNVSIEWICWAVGPSSLTPIQWGSNSFSIHDYSNICWRSLLSGDRQATTRRRPVIWNKSSVCILLYLTLKEVLKSHCGLCCALFWASPSISDNSTSTICSIFIYFSQVQINLSSAWHSMMMSWEFHLFVVFFSCWKTLK